MNSKNRSYTPYLSLMLFLFLSLSLSTSAWSQGKININKASSSELTALPGIGPSKAQAIIDHRAKHGSFRTVDSLQDVRGIGPKTLDKIRPMVTLGDGTVSEPTTEEVSSAAEATSNEINVNTAGAEELRQLTGVGATTATRIVEYRKLHGPFLTVDSITQVKGIGPSILKKNKDRLGVLFQINSASIQDYANFGFKNAKEIISHREKKGSFSSPEALKKIPGTDSEFLAYVRRILK